MKTWIKFSALAVVAALFAVLAPSPAQAGQRGRDNTAIAVVAGVATVGIIAALASHNSNVTVDYRVGTFAPPAPPPPPPHRWVPGHYQTVREKIVHPGYWQTVTEPAQFGWVQHGCRWEYRMIKPAYTRHVWAPERVEWIEKQVWVPGRFEPIASGPYPGPCHAQR